jgi:hypothetical protein
MQNKIFPFLGSFEVWFRWNLSIVYFAVWSYVEFSYATVAILELTSLVSSIWFNFSSLSVRLPIPAYLLALIYFYMSLLSLVLLAGLRTQRTRLLLAWMLLTLLTQFPEGGMVLFMAIYYWVTFSFILCYLALKQS